MVNILLALLRPRYAAITELAGVGALVYGATHVHEAGPWAVAGVALLVKSLELSIRPAPPADDPEESIE